MHMINTSEILETLNMIDHQKHIPSLLRHGRRGEIVRRHLRPHHPPGRAFG